MSKFVVPNKYDQRQCPFNPEHNNIDAMRFPRHLLKCRKQFPNVKYLHCPFNHTHVINPPEQYQYHLHNCPDRIRIDQDISRDTEPKRLRGNIRPPPPSDFQYESTENWDEEEDDLIPSALINMQHAQAGPTSVVHQYPGHSRVAASRPEPAEVRLPKEMPQIMKMTGLLRDPKQAMALAGIGRGAPSLASISGAIVVPMGPGASVSIGRGSFSGQDIQNVNFGRGSWKTPSVASTNQISSTPGGMAGRPPMAGVAPPSNQMQAMPGIARGRGRGRGRAKPKVGHEMNGSLGTPSPPSSEASYQSATDALLGAVFDPEVKISFVTPNVNQQSASSGSHGNVREEDDEEAEAKIVRKLKKKLRDINRLEDKKDEGSELSQEEERKIAMKREIIEQLNALSLSDSE